jgi:hypothetical protein
MPRIETLKEFAKFNYELLMTDRDSTIAVGGGTGEGKSTFMTKLAEEYSEVAKVPFSYDHMTWSRKELLKWIDGEGKSRLGQKPEYSVLIPDELIFMFYKRRWFEDEQIEGVETFNTCRDRHLLIIGACPSFWSLDGAFTSRVRYYVYIPKRSIAWVFMQENNPFVKDPWNCQLNMKWFRRQANPYGLPNFVCEIHFSDWSEKEKLAYYSVRNRKRVLAKEESHDKREKFKEIKAQRDRFMRLAFQHAGRRHGRGKGMSIQEFADMGGLSNEACRLILEGV